MYGDHGVRCSAVELSVVQLATLVAQPARPWSSSLTKQIGHGCSGSSASSSPPVLAAGQPVEAPLAMRTPARMLRPRRASAAVCSGPCGCRRSGANAVSGTSCCSTAPPSIFRTAALVDLVPAGHVAVEVATAKGAFFPLPIISLFVRKAVMLIRSPLPCTVPYFTCRQMLT